MSTVTTETQEAPESVLHQQLKFGPIKASIFCRDTVGPQGQAWRFYDTVIQRRYFDNSKQEWLTSTSLRLDDLPKVALAAQRAYEIVLAARDSDRKARGGGVMIANFTLGLLLAYATLVTLAARGSYLGLSKRLDDEKRWRAELSIQLTKLESRLMEAGAIPVWGKDINSWSTSRVRSVSRGEMK